MAINTIQDAYGDALKYYQKIVTKDAQDINQKWFNETYKESSTRISQLKRAKTASLARVQAMQWKTSSVLTKHYKEQKEYAQLLAQYSKSYIFIQKVRKDITKEDMKYLLNLHSMGELGIKGADGKVINESIYIFSLAELIPTLEVVVNKDHSFALAIKNVEELGSITKDKAKAESKAVAYTEKLLALSKQIATSVNSVKKEGQWIFGMGGIAFESAVRKLANGLINGKTPDEIQGSWEDFEKDTQVFYKAGDLSKEQVQALFGLENTVMELKRISLKSNSVGAGIAKDKTIESALESIKKICKEGFGEAAKQKLEKMFSESQNADGESKKRQQFIQRQEQKIEEVVDDIIQKAFPRK